MGELEDLIREQEADIRRGDYQPGEPGVVHYDNWPHEQDIEMFVRKVTKGRERVNIPECPYHGMSALSVQPGTFTGYRCKGCENEATKRYRATPKGRETTRRANRKYAMTHIDKTREINRRSYAKRMADPEYAAKVRARAKERSRRYRAQAREAHILSVPDGPERGRNWNHILSVTPTNNEETS